jgi:hypothetical protein
MSLTIGAVVGCSLGVTDAAALEALRGIPAERARLDEAELDLIDRARRAGATWAEIGSALGLASRQAAEQRRLRLASSVGRLRQQGLDDGNAAQIVALRAAAVELDRRIGADRRWDLRFPRAELVRMSLGAALLAPPGGLFSLVSDVASDLSAGGAGLVGLPGPTRVAVEKLIAALDAATPEG